MNILYFSHYYPPEGNAPANRVSALARHWVTLGHNVTVITCAPNVPDGKVYPGYKNRLFPQTEEIDGVRVIRVWTYLAPNKGFALRIANYLSYMITAFLQAIFLRSPDVFIATSPQFFCGWAGVFYAYYLRLTWVFRMRRVPFVLEVRDIWPESIGAVEAMKSSFAMRLLERLAQFMYSASDHIVTVGEGYKRQLIAKHVPENKISIVMNGLDKEHLAYDSDHVERIRDQFQLRGYFVCSYVGTVGMACGLDIVLRAAEKLKLTSNQNVRFLIVGDGASREELQTRASKNQLDNVIFAGQQPKSSISAFLAASDACLVHLRRTPLFETVIPSKIFEALGMQRPVIVGVDGEARKLVEQSGGGIYIPPEDEDALIDALQRMTSDSDTCKQMGSRASEYIFRHFDRESLANHYLELLRKICNVTATLPASQ